MGSLGERRDCLPIIDISSIDSQTGDRLIQAASKWGFFYVRNQDLGFTPKTMDRSFDLSRTFFKSPREEKAACAIGPDDRGWSSPYAEVLDPDNQKTGDFKEALNFGEFREGKAQQPLPKSLATNEKEISGFIDRCRNLCMRIQQIFATGLSVDERDGGLNWFSSRHDPSKGPSGTILRLCYYPTLEAEKSSDPSTNPENDPEVVRAAAHTDFGTMTLLFQQPSQPGLEIQAPDSSWYPVEVFPPGTEGDALPPIVVNIGDLLSYWTNGLFKSVMHRVAIPKKRKEDRYSIAYFCHPVATTELVPIPSKLVSEAGDKLPADQNGRQAKQTMTAIEHLKNRLAQVYGWDTEESTRN